MQSTVRSSGLIMRALLLPLTTLKRPKKLIVDCGMLIVERSVHATFPSFVQFNKQLHEIPLNWIFVNGNCEWATAANGSRMPNNFRCRHEAQNGIVRQKQNGGRYMQKKTSTRATVGCGRL